MTAMPIFSRAAMRRSSLISKIGTPPRDCWPTFAESVSNSATNLKAFLPEPWVVGQREPQIARAENRHLQLSLEAQNLPQMALQILDVVADAAHAELAEIGEVFPDLRRVEMKLLRERLRRHGLHAGRIQRVQAAQIHRQPVGGELGDLLVELFALDRQFHKRS